jgi:tRNA (guanine37-N1)-methyltransferase
MKQLLKVTKNFLINRFASFTNKAIKMKFKLENNVKGLKKLDRSLFKCETKLPMIKIEKSKYNEVKNMLKQFLVDLPKVTRKYSDLKEDDALSKTHKGLLLDSEKFKSFDESLNEESKSTLEKKYKFNLDEHFEYIDVKLDYEDFQYEDIIKFVLPDEILNENISAKGFSAIGHIAHFNLKSELSEYKYLIGEVLIDKVTHVKTVVNKINEIDNTYRNFEFEILAGDPDTNVTCKENKCLFKFDFKTVYWNPRLSTEHERIIDMMKKNDVVYDCFAGVGPFSIPAATKNMCIVLANDLNPNSYKFLVDNYKTNHSNNQIKKENEEKRMNRELYQEFPVRFNAFNLDAKDFIKTGVKDHLLKCLKFKLFDKYFMKSKFFVLMNLPALATEFIVAFNGLLNDHSKEIKDLLENSSIEKRKFIMESFHLSVYCYCFIKDQEDLKMTKERVLKDLDSDDLIKIEARDVRKVAPNKEMYCLEFNLPFKVLFKENIEDNLVAAKKIKLDENKF